MYPVNLIGCVLTYTRNDDIYTMSSFWPFFKKDTKKWHKIGSFFDTFGAKLTHKFDPFLSVFLHCYFDGIYLTPCMSRGYGKIG